MTFISSDLISVLNLNISTSNSIQAVQLYGFPKAQIPQDSIKWPHPHTV